MEPHNETQSSQFLLLGISEDSSLQSFLFGLFLSMYLVTVLGNLLIILATVSDSYLHTPMYLFLSNLSFADICFTFTSISKMLVNIQTQSKVITYEGCITQVYFFIVFGVLDNFILAVMAYDHFVAICHPLQYMVIMNLRLCGYLVLGSWITTALNLLQTLTALRLSFCTDLEIPHFVCELNQLVLLACSDTFVHDMVMYFSAVLLGGGPLAGILYSHAKIVSAIHAISSTEGKYKAFSTCASHLSVVSLFYCTLLGVYLSSSVTQNSHSITRASVMYSVVTPMLNPCIYSLRNKDIRGARRRLFRVKP
ncbi:Olfactory receptor 19 [Heterocephalus glaber]|uniref:Olfactory receptor 19 n=1 Tax=Heterocephalus glaber TaxID=10181 RepID=G5BWD9_HETGA|nr:olfactory receptor 19 [Heterocephalus glaber]EHB13600.1 Olfactory receptor 19 [Heterocephalus glaber]